jgi:hypothetical protein
MAEIEQHACFLHRADYIASKFRQARVRDLEAAVSRKIAPVICELHDANTPRRKLGDIPGIPFEGRCILEIIDQTEAASATRSLDVGCAFDFAQERGISRNEAIDTRQIIERKAKAIRTVSDSPDGDAHGIEMTLP